jgi:hypothetical protein
MRYLSLSAFVAFCGLFVSSANAAPIVIPDNYIGAGATHSSWLNQDVIGDVSKFGVDQMLVQVSGGQLSVAIDSSYYNNVGLWGTDMGDLFISTDGWNPFGGSAPYLNDNAQNGENWEYAVVFERTPTPPNATVSLVGASGLAHIFQIPNPQSIILSSAPEGYIYRANQEVRLNTSGLTPVASGSWAITALPGIFDRLTVEIPLSAFANLSDTVGLRWTMTCANDVIEGSAAVPEPLTASLLTLGCATLLRKRRG